MIVQGTIVGAIKGKDQETLGDKSFQVAAPGLWNKLTSEIRAIRSYDHFKRAIKT